MSYTWTNLNAPMHAYYSVAYNDDATYLTCGTGNSIILVYNNGSFTPSTTTVTTETFAIVSSSSGEYLTAIANSVNYKVAVSTDYGTNWTSTNSPANSWAAIASDSTGQNLAAVVQTSVYISTNGGTSWTTSTPFENYALSIASDSTGKYLAAVTDTYIYTSTDGGSNWSTNSNSSGSYSWNSITSDSTGQNLAATVLGGYIYTSTNGGVSWSSNSNSSGIQNWYCITSDSTGQNLAAAGSGGYIYTSNNGGVSWTQQTTPSIDNWRSITSDSTGQYIAVCSDQGLIYSGLYTPPSPQPQTQPQPSTQTTATTTATTTPISDSCFPIGTPIKTDQGIIAIEKIDSNIHTINNKKIVAITKTISNVNYLVCFDKHSLGENYPNQKTIISTKHKIYYRGKMIKADNFLNKLPYIKKIHYNGEILYNVLMEKHELIKVNGLICETLHPNNIIAQLYTEKDLPQEYKQQIIVNLNKKNTTNNNNKHFKNFIRNLII